MRTAWSKKKTQAHDTEYKVTSVLTPTKQGPVMEHLSVFICKTTVGKSVNSGVAPFFMTLIDALNRQESFRSGSYKRVFFLTYCFEVWRELFVNLKNYYLLVLSALYVLVNFL